MKSISDNDLPAEDLSVYRVPARCVTTGWVDVSATSARAARRKVLTMLSASSRPEGRLSGVWGAPHVDVAERRAIALRDEEVADVQP